MTPPPTVNPRGSWQHRPARVAAGLCPVGFRDNRSNGRLVVIPQRSTARPKVRRGGDLLFAFALCPGETQQHRPARVAAGLCPAGFRDAAKQRHLAIIPPRFTSRPKVRRGGDLLFAFALCPGETQQHRPARVAAGLCPAGFQQRSLQRRPTRPVTNHNLQHAFTTSLAPPNFRSQDTVRRKP
jgi:hypothetical protein